LPSNMVFRDKAKNNYSKIEQNMFIIWHDLTTYE
jgi:hypothetical protein